MKHKRLMSLLLIGSMVLSTACNKEEETTTAAPTAAPTETTTESTTESSEETSETTPPADGLIDPNNTNALNPITGIQDLNPEYVGKRGIAVVVNNCRAAMPQRGVSKADAIYEYETEGGITRLLCVFGDPHTCPEIGSLRSARIVSADLASGTNSIFVHFGREPRAVPHFKDDQIDHIDGNYLSGGKYSSKDYADGYVKLPGNIFFWRDKTWASQRAIEHTAVGSGDHILDAINYKKVPLEGETPYMWQFVPDNSKDITESTTECNNLKVKFSGPNDDATFTYDPETKLYTKSQYGKPHMDETTNEPIKTTNVFVLYAHVAKAKKDKYRTDYFLTEGGTGLYASNGKYIEVTWKKDDVHSPIKVYNKAGEEVQVNRGKSYICMVNNNKIVRTKIS